MDEDGAPERERAARLPSATARQDRFWMLMITAGSGVVIAVVLYFAGAFTRSTG